MLQYEEMQIEIHVPRPFLTLGLLAAIGWGAYALFPSDAVGDVRGAETSSNPAAVATADGPDGTTGPADYADDVGARGGGGITQSGVAGNEGVRGVEADLRQAREEQELLRRKADILRGQLRILEAEQNALDGKADPALEMQFQNAVRILKALLQDQRRSEDFLLTSLRQLREAQERAQALGLEGEAGPMITLAWPVKPALGVSAGFHDPSYEERFGFVHDAIDLPVPQGTLVAAAAEGVVEDVVDHGLGFSYVTVRHANGVVTLYGHLTSFRVRSGAAVRAGDPLGFSGGRPGTPGAGLSTGPHLHFGVFHGGAAVDPMEHLPPLSSFVGE